MRHFVKTLSVCLLLADAKAHALGIGDMRVKSSLNDRFSADIVLSLNAGDNPNDIHVQLAPFDKFSERGVPWSRDLLKLKFESVQQNGHSVVIRVRSAGIISEPVLVFLLQARSQKGTVYRQFTVLLDPPDHYEPVHVRQESTSEVHTRHYSAPRASYDSSPKVRRPQYYQPRPKPPALKSSAPIVVAAINKSPGWVSVRKNDGLFQIARRINSGGRVSNEQMAMALFNSNPKAFFSPNINALKAGQSLRVPEHKTVLQLSPSDAKTEFYRQNRVWKEGVLPVPESSPAVAPSPPPVVTTGGQKKLTLTAPTDTLIDQNIMLTDIDKNSPIKPEDSIDILSNKVIDLQDRLEKMEQQMANMQKLLLVKDQQLALLQNDQMADPQNANFKAQLLGILNKITAYFKAESRRMLYITVGFIELLALGLIGYYSTKKIKTKKVKAHRY